MSASTQPPSRRRSIEVPGLGHGKNPIPYATVIGGLLVTGGIAGRTPFTNEVPADLEDEVAMAFANLRAVLDASGFTADDVAKVDMFVADRSIRSVVEPHWLALFPDPASRPSRQTLVQQLPGIRLQMSVLAFRPGEQ